MRIHPLSLIISRDLDIWIHIILFLSFFHLSLIHLTKKWQIISCILRLFLKACYLILKHFTTKDDLRQQKPSHFLCPEGDVSLLKSPRCYLRLNLGRNAVRFYHNLYLQCLHKRAWQTKLYVNNCKRCILGFCPRCFCFAEF